MKENIWLAYRERVFRVPFAELSDMLPPINNHCDECGYRSTRMMELFPGLAVGGRDCGYMSKVTMHTDGDSVPYAACHMHDPLLVRAIKRGRMSKYELVFWPLRIGQPGLKYLKPILHHAVQGEGRPGLGEALSGRRRARKPEGGLRQA